MVIIQPVKIERTLDLFVLKLITFFQAPSQPKCKQKIYCRSYSYPKYAVRNDILRLFTFIESQKFLNFHQ